MSKKKVPVYAPGQENVLNKKATEKDKKEGNITKVTKLSFDELDPS
ncbi:hypothetical protein [Desulfolucanica intricata]|nr:hypothetical protein [Desulfolucanica intricata]